LTETAALSAWWTNDLVGYVRTRLPPHIFVPLALFLWGAASVGRASRVPYEAIALAWTLVAQFRLWDDLADRDEDRARHPERVLARAASLRPFRGLVLALFLVNTAWLLLWSAPAVVLFLALNAFFAAWYAGLRRACPGRAGRAHVVLLKYPAFVYTVAAPPDPVPEDRLVAVAAMVYLTFCIHEVLHDDRLRGAAASVVLAGEMAALALLALRLTASSAQIIAVGIGAALLGALYVHHQRRPLRTPWPYVVFAIAGAWLLVFALAPTGFRGNL
jgi:hypothetical protein